MKVDKNKVTELVKKYSAQDLEAMLQIKVEGEKKKEEDRLVNVLLDAQKQMGNLQDAVKEAQSKIQTIKSEPVKVKLKDREIVFGSEDVVKEMQKREESLLDEDKDNGRQPTQPEQAKQDLTNVAADQMNDIQGEDSADTTTETEQQLSREERADLDQFKPEGPVAEKDDEEKTQKQDDEVGVINTKKKDVTDILKGIKDGLNSGAKVQTEEDEDDDGKNLSALDDEEMVIKKNKDINNIKGLKIRKG